MKEVIFCEDCKYRGCFYGIEIAFCERFGGCVGENDFCSRGEKCEGKRTDNGECVEFGNKERGETE